MVDIEVRIYIQEAPIADEGDSIGRVLTDIAVGKEFAKAADLKSLVDEAYDRASRAVGV